MNPAANGFSFYNNIMQIALITFFKPDKIDSPQCVLCKKVLQFNLEIVIYKQTLYFCLLLYDSLGDSK